MRKAVTLIEVLLVVTLSALLMTAIIPFIRSVSDTWSVGSGKTEILQNGRAALETMTRYIRQARRITRIPDSTQIKIRDRDDTFDITFYYDGGQESLMMRSNETGSDVDSLLAPGVDSLIFNFLQDDGTSAAQANQVKSVQIQMVLSDSTGSTAHTLALEDTIVLRQDVKITSPVWFSHSNQVGELSSDIWVDNFSSNPNSVSVNPTDGSCWVADTGNDRVKKLSSSGTVLLNLSGFNRPQSVSVNSSNGNCWVADTGNSRVKKLSSANGAVLVDISRFIGKPASVSVNPTDGSCWVADTGKDPIKKYSSNGDFVFGLSGFKSPNSVSVNTSDGSCWVADTRNNRVKRVSSDGKTVWPNISGFGQPQSVSVNSSIDPYTNLSGVCWVADTMNNCIKKISPTGTVWTIPGFNQPQSVSVNPFDGSCWVADTGNNRIARLNSAGDIEFDIKGFNSPLTVSASP